MLHEILTLSDYENFNDELDVESIPFFKDCTVDIDRNDLFLSFNPNSYQIFNQEINFEGIKSIKEYDSEQFIKIEKNKNKVDIQSTSSTKIFSFNERYYGKKRRNKFK